MLLQEDVPLGMLARLLLYIVFRFVRLVLLLESAAFAWISDTRKPAEILHIVGRMRLDPLEVASASDFIIFHEHYADLTDIFGDIDWHLYSFDGSYAWFVRSQQIGDTRESLTEFLHEAAIKVARVSIDDFLEHFTKVDDDEKGVSLITISSLAPSSLPSLLESLHVDSFVLLHDPPSIGSLSFALQPLPGKFRRQLARAAVRCLLRKADRKTALLTVRPSLLDTLPLFARIDEGRGGTFIVHPSSPADALSSLLEEHAEYLNMLARVVPCLPLSLLPSLCSISAIYGEAMMKIGVRSSEESSLALFVSALHSAQRCSLTAEALHEEAFEDSDEVSYSALCVLHEMLGTTARRREERRMRKPRTVNLSRSRVRALKRIAQEAFEDEIQWDDDSPIML